MRLRRSETSPGIGRALTLIEVLASLTIVGGAVTLMLVVNANSLRRLAEGDLQLDAQSVARELIAGWALAEEEVTQSGSGTVAGLDDWSWARWSEEVEIAGDVTARKVVLELRYVQPFVSRKWTRQFEWLVNNERHRID